LSSLYHLVINHQVLPISTSAYLTDQRVLKLRESCHEANQYGACFEIPSLSVSVDDQNCQACMQERNECAQSGHPGPISTNRWLGIPLARPQRQGIFTKICKVLYCLRS
jgi:hypothetical protein